MYDSTKVHNVMVNCEYFLKPETSLVDAYNFFYKYEIEYAPVLNDGGHFLGLLFLNNKLITNLDKPYSIKDIMVDGMPSVSLSSKLVEINDCFFDIPVIPVLEDKVFKGFVETNKALKYLWENSNNKNEILNTTIEKLEDQLTELAQKSKEYEAIMENSYDGIAIANSQGITTKVNRSWHRLTGLKKNDIIGIPLNDLVKNNFFSDSVTMKVLKHKEPITIMQKMKSGKQAMMTGSPIFDEYGQLHHVIINIRDVTELHQLKETIEQKELLAEQFQTEISQLRLKQSSEDSIIAESKSMRDLLDLANQIARVETTVLLTGESGVGKGVVARYIHACSQLGTERSFITVNCGAIPKELLESELFGYVDGAFTGAKKGGKPGMFELADGGTLFLDEIAELPLNLQVKLLHAIQEKEITRVGGTNAIKLNVRIISATNKDLLSLMANGEFREDLYYRLNVVPLTIPPLRSRKEDILPLCAHYLNLYNKKYASHKIISNELMDTLLEYDWPGNTRELANLIERMIVTSNSDILSIHSFPYKTRMSHVENIPTTTYLYKNEQIPTLQQANDNLERHLIKRALKEGGTQIKAAEILDVSLSTLIRKMKKTELID